MSLTDGEILALVSYLKQDINLPDTLVAVTAKLEGLLSPSNLPGLLSPVSFWAFNIISCCSLLRKIFLAAL